MGTEQATMAESLTCVGCGVEFVQCMAALSRYDNRTNICSDCGSLEGLAQFAAVARGSDPKAILTAPGKLAEGIV